MHVASSQSYSSGLQAVKYKPTEQVIINEKHPNNKFLYEMLYSALNEDYIFFFQIVKIAVSFLLQIENEKVNEFILYTYVCHYFLYL